LDIDQPICVPQRIELMAPACRSATAMAMAQGLDGFELAGQLGVAWR
jgi:hypothetical protein